MCVITKPVIAMPAVNPRIQVSLKPSLHAVIKRLSEATGNSMSSLVSEFLEPNEQLFQRMALVIEAAASVRSDVRTKVAGNLMQVQDEIESKLGLSHELVSDAADSLFEVADLFGRRDADAPARRYEDGRGGGAEVGVSSPSLTGGSQTPPKARKPIRKPGSKPRPVRRERANG